MKKTVTFIATALVIFMFALTLNNCNKVLEVKDTTSTGVNPDNSKAMVAHILAFKQKMKYYKDNPGVRDNGVTYESDSAVLNMEALLNFNFCYTNVHCNKKSFEHSEVIMPLDNNNEISDADLSTVYDAIIDTIKMQMYRVDYDSMKLLLVDLEITGTDNNGDAVVSVGSLIGNERNIVVTNEEGWWFGKDMGTCQGANAGWDAADQIALNIDFIHFPAPPPGKRRTKTDIITLPVYMPEDFFLVSYEDRDNFEDSRLFYAVEDNDHNPPLHITADTRCVSNNEEIPFYTNNCEYIIDSVEIHYQLELTKCVINWKEETDNSNNQIKIWHELTITLGHVWLVDDAVPVDDILAY